MVSAACALAQPVESSNVPQLLTNHGVKSAMEFVDFYRTFQTAARAIPAATADMEQTIPCAKKPANAACANAEGIGTAMLKFQAARFNLRKSHYQADEALSEVILEIVGRSLSTNNIDQLKLSPDEGVAVRQYLRETKADLGCNFAIAERQWHRTWRHAERTTLRRTR